MTYRTYYQENSRIVWPWGRYRGRVMRELPDSYLEWAVLNLSDQGMAQIAADELARRQPRLRR